MSCDCIYPTVYRSKICNVRKEHKCCECDHKILKGQECEKIDALWEKVFSTIYTCIDCVKLRDYIHSISNELNALNDDECLCNHGELYDYIYNCNLLWTEEQIEDEAAQWVDNYRPSIGVVRGRNCIIETHVNWIYRKRGKLCLNLMIKNV